MTAPVIYSGSFYSCNGFSVEHTYSVLKARSFDAGVDPGFQVRGGAHLKKIAQRGGRHENCLGISCEKSRFYAKKIISYVITCDIGTNSVHKYMHIGKCQYNVCTVL